MIHPTLHRNPVALDPTRHRLLRLRRDVADTPRMAELNSFFVAAGEFVEACREYPLVWIPAGVDASGAKQVAPVAVFGVVPHQNLCIGASGWRTRYVPALLRMYPFALARASDDQVAFCYDASWPGFTLTEGEPLFEADGTPTAFTAEMQTQLQNLEVEVERTRRVGAALLQKNLLQDMRFDATLPDGKTMTVDGFLTVDDKRLAELSDADVLELQRSGVLGLIHAHQVSLGNMRRLIEWHAQRLAAQPA